MKVKMNFAPVHVLVVAGRRQVVILRQAFGIIGIKQVTQIADPNEAIKRLCAEWYDAIFCDQEFQCADDEDFASAARRAPGIVHPTVPIFLVASRARRSDVVAARDAGFTDVLARPVSAATIARKLALALIKPRSFVASEDFFGPDRRGRARPPFAGDERREGSHRDARAKSRDRSQVTVIID